MIGHDGLATSVPCLHEVKRTACNMRKSSLDRSEGTYCPVRFATSKSRPCPTAPHLGLRVSAKYGRKTSIKGGDPEAEYSMMVARSISV
jgi:hypothetical protein